MATCCGKSENLDQSPLGQRQAGDVLAAALWGGNRTERGRATGRRYPRTGNGKQVWVDPRDVAAASHLWQEEPSIKQAANNSGELQRPAIEPVTNIQQLAAAVMPALGRPPMRQYKADHGVQQQSAPDIAAIIRMGQEGVK